MIHAGTITTGSARTDLAVGLYWMISASPVRATTAPLVIATVSPGLNAFVRLAALVAQETLKVGCVIYRAPHEVDPALPQGLLERDRIGREEIGRGDRVERLAANEIEERKMMGRSAMDLGRRFVPPSLGRQKARGVQRKRPLAPLLSAEIAGRPPAPPSTKCPAQRRAATAKPPP